MTTKRKSTATAPTYTTIKIIAKNSAPKRIKRHAVVTKLKMRNKTECTGFLELITSNEEITIIEEKK